MSRRSKHTNLTGDELKIMLQHAHVSQTLAAKETGISIRTMGRYCNNDPIPRKVELAVRYVCEVMYKSGRKVVRRPAKHVITGDELKSILQHAHVLQTLAAKEIGITIRTMGRYCNNEDPVPKKVELAVRYVCEVMYKSGRKVVSA